MYHYTGCALPNVFLQNGYEVVETRYGEGVKISDIEGLHKVLAEAVVCTPMSLRGYEFRFLRSELELSQETLGELLGRDAQAVARWEKGVSKKVDPAADRLLRALYRDAFMGQKRLKPFLERLQNMESAPQTPTRVVMHARNHHWHRKEEAAAGSQA